MFHVGNALVQKVCVFLSIQVCLSMKAIPYDNDNILLQLAYNCKQVYIRVLCSVKGIEFANLSKSGKITLLYYKKKHGLHHCIEGEDLFCNLVE